MLMGGLPLSEQKQRSRWGREEIGDGIGGGETCALGQTNLIKIKKTIPTVLVLRRLGQKNIQEQPGLPGKTLSGIP